jgi:hypothetical protein
MISALQCKQHASEYKALSSDPNISAARSSLLRNIARSLAGLSGQLDRLDSLTREEQNFKERRFG